MSTCIGKGVVVRVVLFEPRSKPTIAFQSRLLAVAGDDCIEQPPPAADPAA